MTPEPDSPRDDDLEDRVVDLKTGEWRTWSQIEKAMEGRLSPEAIEEFQEQHRTETDDETQLIDLVTGDQVTWSEMQQRVDERLVTAKTTVDPKELIPGFASKLDLSDEVQSKANEIIDIGVQHGLDLERSPSGFAAAAIYAASLLCDEKRSQSEIAAVAQVDETMIQSCYKAQMKAIG